MKPKLCIGTAQFGLPYGITNRIGKIPEHEGRRILSLANNSHIKWIDTAQAYGDAEDALGRQVPDSHDFHFISKLSAQQKAVFCLDDLHFWEERFQKSCRSLRVNKLACFLLHQPQDLLKPGGEHLSNWLLSLRDRGLVQHLGMSIYNKDDLQGVNESLLDVVQIPISLFDQRALEDGLVSRLRDKGILVHARSIYLQGLMAVHPEQWPRWTSHMSRSHQQRLVECARHKGCSLIDLALGFIKLHPEIEAVVIGLCKEQQLKELLEAWEKKSPWDVHEWQTWSLHDLQILDPRKWPQEPVA